MGLAILIGVLGACDRFPRDNPVDPAAGGGFAIEASDMPPSISDLNSVAAFANNENGLLEPLETVLVSVPMAVTRLPSPLAVTAVAREVGDSGCVRRVAGSGGAGSLQVPVTLPAAGGAAVDVLVGPFEVSIRDSSSCAPGDDLEFEVELAVAGDTHVVPFELEVSMPEGMVEVVGWTVQDPTPGADGDGILDAQETVILSPRVDNVGDAMLPRLVMRLEGDFAEPQGCVQSALSDGGQLSLGDPQPGESATPAGGFQVTLDPACVMGDEVSLDFTFATANATLPGGATWTATIVGAAPLPDAGM